MKKDKLKVQQIWKNPQFVESIDWKKVNGLIPAIVQNAGTAQVLMLGYMDLEALTRTIKTGRVWFYSRTKKRLWLKGEVSKNFLNSKNIFLDCDSDTLLVEAVPEGSTCHTGAVSCFGERRFDGFGELFDTIKKRKSAMPKNSYTISLFRDGLDKICQKIYEEAAEVVRAARKESPERLIEESADLVYHLLVLLAQKDLELEDLIMELTKRRK